MQKDNFNEADDLLYRAFLLVNNEDAPISERDRLLAEAIEKLGEQFMPYQTQEDYLSSVLRSLGA